MKFIVERPCAVGAEWSGLASHSTFAADMGVQYTELRTHAGDSPLLFGVRRA